MLFNTKEEDLMDTRETRFDEAVAVIKEAGVEVGFEHGWSSMYKEGDYTEGYFVECDDECVVCENFDISEFDETLWRGDEMTIGGMVVADTTEFGEVAMWQEHSVDSMSFSVSSAAVGVIVSDAFTVHGFEVRLDSSDSSESPDVIVLINS